MPMLMPARMARFYIGRWDSVYADVRMTSTSPVLSFALRTRVRLAQ